MFCSPLCSLLREYSTWALEECVFCYCWMKFLDLSVPAIGAVQFSCVHTHFCLLDGSVTDRKRSVADRSGQLLIAPAAAAAWRASPCRASAPSLRVWTHCVVRCIHVTGCYVRWIKLFNHYLLSPLYLW